MLICETKPGLIRARNAADAAFRAVHPDDPTNVARGRSGWYQGHYGASATQLARERLEQFTADCGCEACQQWRAAWLGDGRVLMGCDAKEYLGSQTYDRLHAAAG